MANCAKCGAALPPGAKICDYCGSVVEVPRSPFSGPGGEFQRGFDSSAGGVRFKRTSVGMMVICCLCTLGLYYSIWYVLRRESFKALDPGRKKTGGKLWGLLVVHILYLLVTMGARNDPELAEAREPIFLCFTAFVVYVAWTMRELLRSYAARVAPQNALGALVAPSALWTVLFGPFYLQSSINRMIDARLLEARL